MSAGVPTSGNAISESASFRVPSDADAGILADFIGETTEHLEAADLNLLTLETEPGNPECLNAVFRAFHTIKGVAGFLALEGIKELAHEAENLLDRLRTGQAAMNPAFMDCIFDTVAFFKKTVAGLRQEIGPEQDTEFRLESLGLRKRLRGEASIPPAIATPAAPGARLGDILATSGAVSPEALNAALRKQEEPGNTEKLGEMLVKSGQTQAKQVAQALRVQQSPAVGNAVKETVKVDADRLDRLLDAIGELVIAESMILSSPELKGRVSPKLVAQMSLLDKITRELQEMGTSLRMVPVRPTFQKMTRLVRDLSKQSGKQVNFVTVGEETELDKTVVEKIGDPLVHMLRNSLDHGIESDPAEREKAGKAAVATVKLQAFQKGGNVCVEISDDGRGLNRDAILAKARERGLVRADDPDPADKEIWSFIFDAGFSTAKQVTELSGRGVGMDVVRRNIESLRGRIDIQSQPGQGTVFSIWLPLTLAIIDGLVVRIGKERYVFPTLSIVRIVTSRRDNLLTVRGDREMLSLQGELIPLFPMPAFFTRPVESGAETPAAAGLVVIVESEGRKAGIAVNELLGQQQIVIKKLEEPFRGVPGLSGGAILSDGCVGLILDVDGLMKSGF